MPLITMTIRVEGLGRGFRIVGLQGLGGGTFCKRLGAAITWELDHTMKWKVELVKLGRQRQSLPYARPRDLPY